MDGGGGKTFRTDIWGEAPCYIAIILGRDDVLIIFNRLGDKASLALKFYGEYI